MSIDLGPRYRLLKQLGQGAMGKVFLAEHTQLGRREALKVLQSGLARDAEFVSRFRREARALNRVQHPNVVAVYDFGDLPDDSLYLAMEYADGRPLDQVLRDDGPLPVSRAVAVLVQLAEAVAKAHDCSVIHRDLKPNNMILVEREGRDPVVKVLDFGIAKIVCPNYEESVALTRDGQVFGTPAYMAPEMIQATMTDQRSDIYAIGCIAHELLTGAPPFSGKRVQQWHAHVSEAPHAPSERRPEARIPHQLDAIVLRCLEKRAEHRFQTAVDLAASLRDAATLTPLICPARTAAELLAALRKVGRAPKPTDPDATRPPRGTTAATVPPRPLEPPVLEHADDAQALAETELVGEEELRGARREAALALTERLLDQGVTDHGLVVVHAEVCGFEDDVSRCDSTATSLEGQRAHIERTARRREASLRFAIGELRFDAAREADSGQRAELTSQVDALSNRLRTLLEETAREQQRLDEREAKIVASRRLLDRQRESSYLRLDRVLERLLPQAHAMPSLESTVAEYEGIRSLVARISRPAV